MSIAPTILVHGFSAEGSDKVIDASTVSTIFGDLAARLAGAQTPAIDVNVSRYVSLDDGRDVDDISLQLDRILRTDFPQLLTGPDGFNAIVHSTGALVMRNWVRRYSPRPSPLKHLIHLAGANLGSGWAHVGASDLAKWLRIIVLNGEERGLAVLSELELGSAWTIDLHRYFLEPGQRMVDFGIMEFNIVGSQTPAELLAAPVKYGREDGSDGVVRVCASNLNFNYLEIVPAVNPVAIDWDAAQTFSSDTTSLSANGGTANFAEGMFAGNYYTSLRPIMAGSPDIPEIPLAIPYYCDHISAQCGIVSGQMPKAQVTDLILQALNANTDQDYANVIKGYAAVLDYTVAKAVTPEHSANILANLVNAVKDFLHDPAAQYYPHAQVIVRVFDQNYKPIASPSIHFNSMGGSADPVILIDTLIEDVHQNTHSPNTNTYYIKTHEYQDGGWVSCLQLTNGIDLEIDCVDPLTNHVKYIPLRMRLDAHTLEQYVEPNRTTIIDVYLLRLPEPNTFSMFGLP